MNTKAGVMITNSLVKIYAIYYKKGMVLNLDKMYQPIMAGNALIDNNPDIPGDDTHETISKKNPYFSELTGIYWVWKNTNHEITGICHYRRYFTALPEPFLYRLKRWLYFTAGLYKKRYGLIYTGNTRLFKPRILSESEVRFYLQQYDAVLPVARKLKYTVETHFRRYHDINDLALLKSIIQQKYPEFENAYNTVLRGKRLHANNMFILKKTFFNEFMEWWFDILFEFEKRVDLSTKRGYQERIIGFIAERLLNVWVVQKQLNYVELPIIYFKKLKNN